MDGLTDRAAFAYARKLTYQPYQVSDADIDQLRKHYSDLQILEIILSARKLAAAPIVLTDDNVDEGVKLAGPSAVVQLINYTTVRASFDRITEAAGLQLEE